MVTSVYAMFSSYVPISVYYVKTMWKIGQTHPYCYSQRSIGVGNSFDALSTYRLH